MNQDQLFAVLRFDAEAGKFFWLTRHSGKGLATWNARWAGKVAGNVDPISGYVKIRVMGKNQYAHRLVWTIIMGREPLGEIDHINGDRTDNRPQNLREVNRQGNSRNAAKNARNTSGTTGVKWHRQAGKWQAQITIDGRDIYLGLFDDRESAIIARKAAEKVSGFHRNHGRDPVNLHNHPHA